MKLKYKKVFLLILLSTMGIGILTLSVAPKDKTVKDSSSEESENSNDEEQAAITSSSDQVPTQKPLITLIPTPTQAPTPTPLPVYALEDEGYPEIEKLIKDYYDAKLNCDVDEFKNILSNDADIPSLEQLQTDIMFVEKYQAIKSYVKKSYEKGAYIVYAYYEIKYLNIDTPAPAAKSFYIITDSESKLQVLSGKLDENRQEYYDARLQDEDVQKLIQETNAKGKEAEAKDELLKTFWEKLKASQETSDAEDTSGN